MTDAKKQCAAKTTKKAWNNPLAPRARCSKDALPGRDFCAVHQRKADEREARDPGSSVWMRGGK